MLRHPARERRTVHPKIVSDRALGAPTRQNEADGLIPYLDYTTPTAGDEFAGAIQEMLAGRTDPKEFTGKIQSQFEDFVGSL